MEAQTEEEAEFICKCTKTLLARSKKQLRNWQIEKYANPECA
jgi:hypothetical protein